MQVLVARIGRPHGLKGEVTVQVHTDTPQERFVAGARFDTEPVTANGGVLTLRSMRVHNGITLLGFEEAADRSAAEALRGTKLYVGRDDMVDTGPGADDGDGDGVELEDGWYEDELIGLAVVTTSGKALGEVTGLMTRPAQDLLVVRLTSGGEALVPFVEAIVPEVDPGSDDGTRAGRVVIDPPPGLLDLAGE